MEKVIFFNEKKFMWDGMTYDNESDALSVKAEYEKNNFKTHVVREDDKFYVFTQRIVTEIEVEQH